MDIKAEQIVFAFLVSAVNLFIYVNCQRDYLFFAAPQKLDPLKDEGLYGGPIRYQAKGNASQVYEHGLTCRDLHKDSDRGLPLKSISYDPISSKILIHVGEGSDDSYVKLVTIDPCAANYACPNKFTQVALDEKSYSHKLAAFAHYAGKIYFISSRTIKETPTVEKLMIELRWMNGCGEDTINPFSVDRCSTLVAVVISETYTTRPKYKTTSGLVVVPIKRNKEDSLVYFVQLQQTITDDELKDVQSSEAFVLYRVTYEGEVSREHEELVQDYLNKYVVVAIGQISERGGLMCWTALDRVVCGEVDSIGRLSNARVVIERRHVKLVCKAPLDDDDIASITTGVAIAKVPKNINKDEMVIYFGCMAQVKDIGGAGLVRKTGRGPAQVFPLRIDNDGSRVLAGSMFVSRIQCSGDINKPANVLSTAGISINRYSSNSRTSRLLVFSSYLFCYFFFVSKYRFSIVSLLH